MNAIISNCGQYRYQLKRHATQMYPTKGAALFLMLNPSTADASTDDPTIRRCKGFAEYWDCNGIVVANLYALRATNPADLWKHGDPVGPENDFYLHQLANEFEDVVFAFGANARADRVSRVHSIFEEKKRKIWCLGVMKDGSPRHPLYVRADQPLIEWRQP